MSDSLWPLDCTHKASRSMGLSRQEYWSGLPFPSPVGLPDSRIKPTSLKSLALQAGSLLLRSVQFSCLVVSGSLRLHDCSMPGLPVHHQLPEFTQTHVHWVGDAMQPSHPLSSSSPVFNRSQHQSRFQWVSYLNQVAKVLDFQLQHQSFQWITRTDFL